MDGPINLADYMTLREAATTLRKSTKQVRRYIHDGRLKAIMLGKLYILRSSVEDLARQPVQIEDYFSRQVREIRGEVYKLWDKTTRDNEEIKDIIAHIVQRIDEMDRHINELKSRSAPAHVDIVGRQETRRIDKQEDYVIIVSSLEELPEDAISLRQFAEEEHINRRTLRDFIVTQKLPHYGIVYRESRGDIHRYFTQEQQAMIRTARKKLLS